MIRATKQERAASFVEFSPAFKTADRTYWFAEGWIGGERFEFSTQTSENDARALCRRLNLVVRAALKARPAPSDDVVVRPLKWRVPDNDELGHEDCIWTATGIGGSYDIGPSSGGFILWWAADPFTFQEDFATVDEAKAAAENDWQKSIRAALASLPRDTRHRRLR